MDVKTGFLLKPFELYTDGANFDIVGFVSGLVNAPTFMIEGLWCILIIRKRYLPAFAAASSSQYY
jgi:hypothetical protein